MQHGAWKRLGQSLAHAAGRRARWTAARTVPRVIPRQGTRSQNLGTVAADAWHAGSMDDLRMEPAFTDLYDNAKEALAQGYRRADQLVYNFAMDYDISPEGAWKPITHEASQRGEDVIKYLSENPLDERSYKLKNAQRQAGRVVGSQ